MRAAVFLGASLACIIACTSHRTVNKGDMYPWRTGAGRGVLHLYCTYTAPYCGGAEIDPSEYPRPQPWQGEMYLRLAQPDSTGRYGINHLRERILDTIRTGDDGHGYISLPAGHYLLLDSDRADRKRYDQLLQDFAKPKMHHEAIDKACMKRWLYGLFNVITITSGDTVRIDTAMHGQCPWYATPCVPYHGPLPP